MDAVFFHMKTMLPSRDLVRRVLCCLVPSYIQNRSTATDTNSPRLQATSALDGLRGIAALFVFFFHILFSYGNFVEYGYGRDKENSRLIQLPFFRIFYAGHAMVAIFFVVGGYVISIQPLKLIHSGQMTAFHNTLVSSIFRRGIRLYLPALAATFITMVTVYVGLFEYPRQFITEDRQYIYYSDLHPNQLSSIGKQLSDWFHQTKLLTNIFTYYTNGFMLPYYPHYDPHLWTVPFEYRSSTLVALALLAFSRCHIRARVILMICTILFCGMWDRWELVCFLGGSLLCEFDMTSRILYNPIPLSARQEDNEDEEEEEEEKLPDLESHSTTREKQNALISIISDGARWVHKIGNKRICSASLTILSLYLLSCPNLSIEDTPGYSWLSSFIPSSYSDAKRFPHTLGALLITFCTTRSVALQRVFNTPFAQYLGKTSYALYIVHGPLIHIVGYSVTPNVWRYITGMETAFQWWLGLGIGSAILGICVAVAADWFWRVVDVWSVAMSRRVEGWCFASDQ